MDGIYTSSYAAHEIDGPTIVAFISLSFFFLVGVVSLAKWLGGLYKKTVDVPTPYPDYLFMFHPPTEQDSASRMMLESMRDAVREGYNPEFCLKEGDSLHPDLATYSSIDEVRCIASEYMACLEDMSEEQEL